LARWSNSSVICDIRENCAGNRIASAYRLIRCKIFEVGLMSSADAAAAA
jgi:hypothetical protein